MEQNNTQAFWLSPQQKRICLLESGVGPYRAMCWVEFNRRMEAGRLKSAIEKVVARHEILRTLFRGRAGLKIPFQIPFETGKLSWQAIDLINGQAQPEKLLEELWQREQQRNFDLEQGPLLSATLIEKGENASALLLTMPSLCADRHSLDLLVDEISKTFAGQPPQGEPLRYVQFAQWANDLLESDEEVANQGKKFWQEQEEFLPAKLPQEIRRDERLPFSPKLVLGRVDDVLRTRMDALLSTRSLALREVLLCVWQVLLWRITLQPSFRTAVVFDGREYEELQATPGLVAKNLPLVSRFEADYSFEE
ncbi:MAG: hypothetical protein JO249_20095, partial [Acidobacteria bacterium]|nr:hypothetical protein [Acidobacteriota bacterium]